MTDEKTFDNITMSKLSVDDADTSITLKPPFTQKNEEHHLLYQLISSYYLCTSNHPCRINNSTNWYSSKYKHQPNTLLPNHSKPRGLRSLEAGVVQV
jgi:hypothetical protein